MAVCAAMEEESSRGVVLLIDEENTMEHVSNKEIFKKMGTRRILILARKRLLRFLGHRNRKVLGEFDIHKINEKG